MADLSILLSLEKAKLVKRARNNHLGTKELVLDYNLQTSATREESMVWLEANRLTLTDPTFSFKTYTGTWKCIEIAYNEDKKVIRQRFQIDSSLENDRSEVSAAGTSYRSYYWRIVDPSDYNIPYYKITGTNNQGLDGAYWYDTGTEVNSESVYRTLDEAYSLWNDSTDWVITLVEDEDDTPTNYYDSTDIADTYSANGTFTGTPAIATVEASGETFDKRINDNGDGTYDVTISRTVASSSPPSGTGITVGGSLSGVDTTVADYGDEVDDSIYISGCVYDTTYNGTYERNGTFNGYPKWEGMDSGADNYGYILEWEYTASSNKWEILNAVSNPKYFTNTFLSTNEWRYTVGVGGTSEPTMVLEIGRPPRSQREDVTITINSSEQKLVSDGGTITDPVDGELKSISNVPLPSGKYRTTVATKTAISQRSPALYDMMHVQTRGGNMNGIIIGRNRTLAELNSDLAVLDGVGSPLYDSDWGGGAHSNSASVAINQFGRYDYTITSMYR